MRDARHTIEVDAPCEVLYGVITDYEAYPEFVSFQRDARVLKRGPGETLARFSLEILFTVHYTVRFVERAPTSVSWALVESDVMRANDGEWRLEPLAGGRTRAHYRVAVGIGRFVPPVVVEHLAGHTLPATLEAFKRRAESRAPAR